MVCNQDNFWSFQITTPLRECIMLSKQFLLNCCVVPLSRRKVVAVVGNRMAFLHQNSADAVDGCICNDFIRQGSLKTGAEMSARFIRRKASSCC